MVSPMCYQLRYHSFAVKHLFVSAQCQIAHNYHRAISLKLKWYKIVCMRYLACTFSQMKSINMFSMFLLSWVPRHFLWRFISLWTYIHIYNLTVFMFMYVNVDPSSGNIQKHGYLECFHAASARGNISGVWVIDDQHHYLHTSIHVSFGIDILLIMSQLIYAALCNWTNPTGYAQCLNVRENGIQNLVCNYFAALNSHPLASLTTHLSWFQVANGTCRRMMWDVKLTPMINDTRPGKDLIGR